MKIFKYLSICLLLAIAPIMQSCSIEEELVDTATPELIRNENDVQALINGLYARFNDASAFKFQGFMMLTLMADDLFSDAGSEFGPYGNRTISGVNTGSFWGVFYASIASSNNLIKTLDRLELDPAFEKRAYGEAHFIRAFSYYYLVRLYGGVPLRLDAVDINSDFYLPRSSVDEVYAQIFSDFGMASKSLPLTVSGGELGRATKLSAQALMAQASLTYGNQRALKAQDATPQYQQAVAYADSVIAVDKSSDYYKLLPNFADLFEITKETAAYQEVLFGIRFQVDNQNRAQPAAGSEFALRFMPTNTTNTTGKPNGTGGGSVKVMPWFGDFYRTGDYVFLNGATKVIDFRNEVSFYQVGVNTAGFPVRIYPNVTNAGSGEGRVGTPIVGKYIDPNGKDDRNNGNDFFVIRLAEVYLIKAEAENELNGPTPAALEAFNTVRARARQADGPANARPVPADVTLATPLTKGEFRMKIFHDRGLELVGEGQRWFDLVRMQHPANPAKTMYEYQMLEELPKSTYPKTLPTWRPATNKWSNAFAVYAPSLNVTVPKFLLFPVPTGEILNNPKIGLGNQNPGW